jgi:hypothetical protein
MGTIAQLGFDQDTFRGRRIKSKQADERASPLSKALADRTGMGTPAQWEFATRDIGTGYAGMVHGLSDIVAGTERTRKTSPQERPLTGGLYGRVVKGSIGGVAERETDQGGNWLSQSQLVTPSAERILTEQGVKWRPTPASPEIDGVPLTRSEYGEPGLPSQVGSPQNRPGEEGHLDEQRRADSLGDRQRGNRADL